MNPYTVVRQFEEYMAKYVGSPFAVAIDNGTNALFLCCKYLNVKEVTIPNKTYVSVPSAIIHAGGTVLFEDISWQGSYQLSPYPIFDCACELSRSMYVPKTYQCVSFSANKLLNIGKGGMIFTDDEEATRWFKLARYEGREEMPFEQQKKVEVVGWNMYMTPEQAARGLTLVSNLKDVNIFEHNYVDLSKVYFPAK